MKIEEKAALGRVSMPPLGSARLRLMLTFMLTPPYGRVAEETEVVPEEVDERRGGRDGKDDNRAAEAPLN